MSSIQIQGRNVYAASNSNSSIINDGDSVLVRVEKPLGDGASLVLLNGQRIKAFCAKTLAAGETFRAVVSHSQDGRLLLTVSEKSGANNSIEPRLADFLVSNAIQSDGISAQIVRLMQQFGVKIDCGILRRARELSAKFPGKEKLAAEAASILMEKGIEPEYSLVCRMLGITDGSFDTSPQSQNHGEEQKFADGEGTYFGLFGKIPQAKEGLLALLNHSSFSSDKHWICVPFELNNAHFNAKGTLSFLLNLNSKLTEKIRIKCNTDYTNYIFVLYYSKSKVKEVRFCTLPPLLTSQIHNEEKWLGDLFSSGMNTSNSVPVTYSSLTLTESLCADDQIPITFEDIV